MPSVEECIRILTGAGMDAQKARESVIRADERMKAIRAEGKIVSDDDLINEFARQNNQDVFKKYQKQREVALKAMAFDQRVGEAISMTQEGLRPSEGVLAQLTGSIKNVAKGRQSINLLRNVKAMQYQGPMQKFFMENRDLLRLMRGMLPRKRAAWGEFTDRVTLDLLGAKTGDERAAELAAHLRTAFEMARMDINRAGGATPRLDNWIPRNYYAKSVMARSEAQFLTDTLERLDLERTFNYLYDGSFDFNRFREENPQFTSLSDIDARRQIIHDTLKDIRKSILMGRDAWARPSEKGGIASGLNVAARYSKHRFLFFKDAASEMEFFKLYGHGDIIDASVRYFQHVARDWALMKKFGPNPQLTLAAYRDRLADMAMKDPEFARPDRAAKGKPITEAHIQREVNKLSEKRGTTLNALTRVALGESLSPENISFARVSAFVRNIAGMARLGRATISALADLPIHALSFKMTGSTLLESWDRTFWSLVGGKKSGDLWQNSYLLSALCDGVTGSAAHRFYTVDGPPGFTANLQETFYRATLLTQWTDNFRMGAVQERSAEMGLMVKRSWDSLPPAYRAALEQHGIDPAQWEALGYMVHPAGQKTYVLPERVDTLPERIVDQMANADIERAKNKLRGEQLERRLDWLRTEAKEKLQINLLGFFRDQADNAVLVPDDYTQMLMTWGGTKPGTIAGEISRTAMTLKSFGLTYARRVPYRMIAGRAPDKALFQAYGDLAFHIALTTIFGYISMSAKHVLDGKKPLDPARDPYKVFTAAFVQGGGAGIYGDFLFGRYNRFGRSFAETMSGPVFGDAIGGLASLYSDAVEGKFSGAKAFKTLWDNTPFVNLWWSKFALDYLIVYNMMELTNPGSVRRMERRMRRYSGQEYFLPPSAVTR